MDRATASRITVRVLVGLFAAVVVMVAGLYFYFSGQFRQD
jgi:Tfp pilus assembly protein PilO